MLRFHSSVYLWFLFVVLLMVQTPVLLSRFSHDPVTRPTGGSDGHRDAPAGLDAAHGRFVLM